MKNKMMNIRLLVPFFISVVTIKGDNIMLNKPSFQSSTFDNMRNSNNANDGNRTGNASGTNMEVNPFWQGNLQGYYLVTSINLTSAIDWLGGTGLQNATVGVSVHDINCPNSEFTLCGQWPDDDLRGPTITFNCPQMGPVRFVVVRREGSQHLVLGEVEVEGMPSSLSEMMYDYGTSKMVMSPTESLTAVSVINCGTTCLLNQPCLAFSYHPGYPLTCLLATNATMTTDPEWVSYTVKDCFNP